MRVQGSEAVEAGRAPPVPRSSNVDGHVAHTESRASGPLRRWIAGIAERKNERTLADALVGAAGA